MTTEELYYRAAMSGDNRFDGWVYVGVTSTGIYCRPSCPAKTPKRANMRFFRTAGSAQAAGFRACKRCRPEVTPGSPEWNVRADLAGRAMRLIADGLVDREGVTGLAARLNYSERQLRRQLQAELGAGPQALARGQRSRTAQLLLATTDLSMSDVAFAAGFVSIRQFNETIRDVFAQTPTQLRARSARYDSDRAAAGAGVIVVRLPFRAPLNLTWSLRYLGERAVPGVEEYEGGVYRRVLALPHATGVVSFTPEADAVMAAAVRSSTSRPVVRCELQLEDLRDLTAAVQRCRALLDLDADPQAIDAVLGADAILAPVVSASPGRRVPGTGDPAELALRAVLAQDVEGFAGAEAARLVARFGKPLTVPIGSITHTFPPPEILAEADLSGLDLDPRRQVALRAMATALANGDVDLDVGADREQAVEQLRAIPELKPITIATVRMRALGDPDVFVPDDPTVARVLHEHGISDRAAVTRHTENWRPWRSYAVSYLLDSMNSTFARV